MKYYLVKMTDGGEPPVYEHIVCEKCLKAGRIELNIESKTPVTDKGATCSICEYWDNTDKKERQILKAHGRNLPVCPKCGSWNALLDEREWDPDNSDIPLVKMFRCRDCGWTIRADRTTVIILEVDKPGMGHLTTFHEVRWIPGERY